MPQNVTKLQSVEFWSIKVNTNNMTNFLDDYDDENSVKNIYYFVYITWPDLVDDFRWHLKAICMSDNNFFSSNRWDYLLFYILLIDFWNKPTYWILVAFSWSDSLLQLRLVKKYFSSWVFVIIFSKLYLVSIISFRHETSFCCIMKGTTFLDSIGVNLIDGPRHWKLVSLEASGKTTKRRVNFVEFSATNLRIEDFWHLK